MSNGCRGTAASWSTRATSTSRRRTSSSRWEATRFHGYPFAKELDPSIRQLDVGRYRNPAQLQDGPALVVGVGNSGAEIALELGESARPLLAGTEAGHVPFRIESAREARVFLPLMFRVVGHRVLTVRTPIGRKMRPAPRPRCAARAREAGRSRRRRHRTRPSRRRRADGLPLLEDDRVVQVANIIWCTGFLAGLLLIDLPIFGDEESPIEPIHHRGIVGGEPGLYFVGLHFLYAMSSGFLPGVGRDAEHVVEHIASRVA